MRSAAVEPPPGARRAAAQKQQQHQLRRLHVEGRCAVGTRAWRSRPIVLGTQTCSSTSVPARGGQRCYSLAHSDAPSSTTGPSTAQQVVAPEAGALLATRQQHREGLVKQQATMLYRFLVPEYVTRFGESLKVVGSLPELGSWDVKLAPAMTWHEGHRWVFETRLPRANFEFKVVALLDHEVRWEQGVNRVVQAEGGGGIHDVPVELVINLMCSFGATENTGVELVLDRQSMQESYELASATLELLCKRRARLQKSLQQAGAAADGAAAAAEAGGAGEASRLEAALSSQSHRVEDLGQLMSAARLSEDGQHLLLSLGNNKVHIPKQLGSVSRKHHASSIHLALSSGANGASSNGHSSHHHPHQQHSQLDGQAAPPHPASDPHDIGAPLPHSGAAEAQAPADSPSTAPVIQAAHLVPDEASSSYDSDYSDIEPDDAAAALAAAAFATLPRRRSRKHRNKAAAANGNAPAPLVAQQGAPAPGQPQAAAAAVPARNASPEPSSSSAPLAPAPATQPVTAEARESSSNAAGDVAPKRSRSSSPLLPGVDLDALPRPEVKSGGVLFFSAALLAAVQLPRSPSRSTSPTAASAAAAATAAGAASSSGNGNGKHGTTGDGRGGVGAAAAGASNGAVAASASGGRNGAAVNGGGNGRGAMNGSKVKGGGGAGGEAEVVERLAALSGSMTRTLERVVRTGDAHQSLGVWREVEAQLQEAQALQERLMAAHGGLGSSQREELQQLQQLVKTATEKLGRRKSVMATISTRGNGAHRHASNGNGAAVPSQRS